MTDLQLWRKAREYLMTRRTAYVRTFNFDSPTNQAVLADIAKFCRANESTHNEDTHVAAKLDGRREVWLRIQHHLRLTPEQLWQLYSGLKE
jgi:hypothetical protein